MNASACHTMRVASAEGHVYSLGPDAVRSELVQLLEQCTRTGPEKKKDEYRGGIHEKQALLDV